MGPGSPRWEQINPSPFEHEQAGLDLLRGYLPEASPYHVWANVEFVGTDGSVNEVDALVLTPAGLHLLELKHWQGEIAGNGVHWLQRAPGGSSIAHDNPLIATNRKARRLAGLMRHYRRGRGDVPFVLSAIFLHARSSKSKLDEVGCQHVYGLDGHERSSGLGSVKKFLTEPSGKVDARRGKEIVELVRRCGIKPSTSARRVDGLLLGPAPFAEGVGWQDFLAEHPRQGSLQRRVRIYLSRQAPEDEAAVIRRAAEREFNLLQGIHHPGIARALNIVDYGPDPAVIFDHAQGSARFDQWLTQTGERLTFAQKLTLLDELAQTVEYAHARRLAHRGLYPRAILVTEPDSARPALVVTDWQAAGRLASTTSFTSLGKPGSSDGVDLLFDDGLRRYQAPEAAFTKDRSGVRLDVFGLGAIAYRMFTGQDPAAGAEDLRDGGLVITDAADAMPQSLVDLVFEATFGDPRQRTQTVMQFRTGVEKVWDEVTAPEPEPVIDPLHARKGDRLDNGLEVVRQLGSGATSVVLLVRRGSGDDSDELVLKVAREERHAERFAAEARALRRLRDSKVVALIEEMTVGGRTALLMESAGKRTLAQELQGGRLALDLLKRFGDDLLDVLSYLDGVGVWHRDIKPSNLGLRESGKDRELRLCVFDFSLTETPADNLTAGTNPYLDPFLGGARRPRYDSDAERFAAAVTLFEMASGRQPSWGGAHPTSVTDEVTLDPGDFDRAFADAFAAFFRKALARQARERFDTTVQMAEAWREVFRTKQTVTPRVARLTRDSELAGTDLSDGARSALEERLEVHTVGALLDLPPSRLTSAKGVTDAAKREIRAEVRRLRELIPDAVPDADRPEAHGVGVLSAKLLNGIKDGAESGALALALGQAATAGGAFLAWPLPREVARHTGGAAPQISHWLGRQAKKWRNLNDLTALRDEMVSIVDTHGGVMSAEELAAQVLVSRGSTEAGARRLPQAMGLVRAAVEAELALGGDARLDQSRPEGVVLIGREPGRGHTASELLDYVAELGRRAAALLAAEDLPSRRESVQELRTVPEPEGFPVLEEGRLLQVAAAASPKVAINAQGQLYPVGLPAERAIRHASGSLATRGVLTESQVQERVKARFPQAADLPPRHQLDELLERCDIPLVWDRDKHHYRLKGTMLVPSSRLGSTGGVPALAADAAHAQSRLEQALSRATFLAMLTRMRDLSGARRELLARFGLTEINVTNVLLERLRATGIPWELLVAADTGVAGDADFKSLTDLVKHKVVPVLREALDTDVPLLITEAAPLVRYGQMTLIAELADTGRAHRAARLLLVPGGRPEPALIEREQIPLTNPATQAVWLPVTWMDNPAPAGRTV